MVVIHEQSKPFHSLHQHNFDLIFAFLVLTYRLKTGSPSSGFLCFWHLSSHLTHLFLFFVLCSHCWWDVILSFLDVQCWHPYRWKGYLRLLGDEDRATEWGGHAAGWARRISRNGVCKQGCNEDGCGDVRQFIVVSMFLFSCSFFLVFFRFFRTLGFGEWFRRMEKRLIPAVLISLTMALRIPFSNWQFSNKVILNVPSGILYY